MEQKVIITAESFDVKEEKNKGFMITGLALPFDRRSRNGLVYNKESIMATVEMWTGLPCLFNHNTDHPIGHITNTWITDEGLHYSIDVDNGEEDIVRKLQRKDIPFTSIQAMVDKTTEDMEGDVLIKEPLEISVCTLPGFPQTNIQAQKVDTMTISPDTTSSTIMDSVTYPYISIPEGAVAIEAFMGREADVVSEHFGDYKDFADCVSKNQDRDSPEGFCAWLHKKITGKWPSESIQVNNIRSDMFMGDKMADEENKSLEVLESEVNLLKTEFESLKARMEQEPEEPPVGEPTIDDRVKALEDAIVAIQTRLDEIEKKISPEEPTATPGAPSGEESGGRGDNITREELIEKLRKVR